MGYLLLYLGYLAIFIWLNSKTSFFINSGINSRVLTILFCLKIVVGVSFVLVNFTFTETDLTSTYKSGLQETAKLLNNPSDFISSFSMKDYDNSPEKIFSSHHSYWNDIRYAVVDKLVGILNLFCFKNFYVVSLLFNYLMFYGHIALYRAFSNGGIKHTAVKIIGSFLIPSSLFFLSGINKDSLFFLGLCLTVYAATALTLPQKKKNITGLLFLLIFGLFITFVIRNFFFLLLLPALVVFFAGKKTKLHPLLSYAVVYVAGLVVFFNSPFLMQALCDRQLDFLQLGQTKSFVPVQPLEANITSIISHFPKAVEIGFLLPYAWDSYNIFYFAASIEVWIILLVIFAGTWIALKSAKKNSGNYFYWFCIFYSVSALLITGYTIPYMGAVIRYKTAFLPFLLTPFLNVFFSSYRMQQLLQNLRRKYKFFNVM